MMGAILLIIAFVVYFKWFDYALDKRVDYYDVSKIDTLKMTKALICSGEARPIRIDSKLFTSNKNRSLPSIPYLHWRHHPHLLLPYSCCQYRQSNQNRGLPLRCHHCQWCSHPVQSPC